MSTKEELRKLMSAANLKMKVIIEKAASSGIWIGTLIGLKVEDLDFEADEKVALIKVRPELSETNIRSWALISNKARSFQEQYIETYKIKSGWTFPARGGGPMTYNSVQHRWGRLLRKTGLKMKSRNMHVLHLHTLRRWFRTRLERIPNQEPTRILNGAPKEGVSRWKLLQTTKQWTNNKLQSSHAHVIYPMGWNAKLRRHKEKNTTRHGPPPRIQRRDNKNM